MSTLDHVFMVMASYNDDAEIMVDSLHATEATADERAKELNAPPRTWPHWCVVEWPITGPIPASETAPSERKP